MLLKDKLKELREDQRISQEELSEISGISVRTIQRIEKGEVEPRPYTIRELLKALNISVEDFNNYEDSIQKSTGNINRFRALNLMVFILPILVIFVLLRYWKKHHWSDNDNLNIKVVLSFQLLWAIFSILVFLFVPFLISAMNAQYAIGKLIPTPFLIHLVLCLANIILVFIITFPNSSYGAKLKKIIPNLF